MKARFLIFCLFLCILELISSVSSSPTSSTNSSTCPMDLGYVLRIPWSISDCKTPPNPNSTQQISPTSGDPTAGKRQCCQTLLSLYGLGLSQHLKETSLFQLPNLPTSVSCLEDFQSKLNSLFLPQNLTSICFDPLQFVITPNICASIESTEDWSKKLGPFTILDSACKPDLTDLTQCDACLAAGLRVQTDLIAVDGNKSHSTECFYFAVLYAAGIVNEFGPESTGALTCIFGLSIDSDKGSSSKRHLALVFGLTGAGVAILLMSCLLGMYLWWNRRRMEKHDGINSGEEEMESRSRKRPTTVAICFGVVVLEIMCGKKALDLSSESPRAILITDWAWSLVKAGKLESVLDASLLKDGDSSNANPKLIMERFVLVGILCAHVMVALRPTILDALKMLEGDIEVPTIPDRPTPLGHPSFFGGEGNTFSISPALSGLQLYSVDMLR
ncbi:unnamed protein product [Fraxinus pennsylvanica]|uniref:SPARK domain-containing protein n=1 Tax=Fraxinus pennsylvanica TaxID=56036 RepID=A0AAD1Z7A2_9LAMI|nr:unnamed protein product [Fraxinus pennsylvanica]